MDISKLSGITITVHCTDNVININYGEIIMNMYFCKLLSNFNSKVSVETKQLTYANGNHRLYDVYNIPHIYVTCSSLTMQRLIQDIWDRPNNTYTLDGSEQSYQELFDYITHHDMYLFNNSIKIIVSRSNEIYISALMYFKKQIPSTNVYDFISNINSGSFYYFCKVSWDYLIRGNLDVELVVDLICKLCNKHNSINMAPNTLLQIFRGIIKLYCRDASTSMNDESMNDENIDSNGTKDKIRDVVTTASVHKIISNYIHVAPPGKIYDIQNDCINYCINDCINDSEKLWNWNTDNYKELIRILWELDQLDLIAINDI